MAKRGPKPKQVDPAEVERLARVGHTQQQWNTFVSFLKGKHT